MSHWQGISCKRYLQRVRNRERFLFFFKGFDFFLKVHRMPIFPADSWHRETLRSLLHSHLIQRCEEIRQGCAAIVWQGGFLIINLTGH